MHKKHPMLQNHRGRKTHESNKGIEQFEVDALKGKRTISYIVLASLVYRYSVCQTGQSKNCWPNCILRVHKPYRAFRPGLVCCATASDQSLSAPAAHSHCASEKQAIALVCRGGHVVPRYEELMAVERHRPLRQQLLQQQYLGVLYSFVNK